MTDTLSETPAATPSKDRSQAFAAIILGIAATLAALAAYNGNLADGDALQGYTNSTASLNDANAFWAQGNTVAAADQSLFVEYANASFAGEAERAAYLRTLMRPELDDAVTWWESTEEAETPFDEHEANPYTVAPYDEALALEEQAETQFEEGVAADKRSDAFDLATVVFALTLFFGGIATLFASRHVTRSLLALAVVALVVGSVTLVRGF